MKSVQQVILGLLGLALMLILAVTGGYAFHRATYHPALYIPPPAAERKGTVQMVREATDLEALKKICYFWAEGEDRNREMVSVHLSVFDRLMKSAAVAAGFIGIVFFAGLLYVYLVLRRTRRAAPNAL